MSEEIDEWTARLQAEADADERDELRARGAAAERERTLKKIEELLAERGDEQDGWEAALTLLKARLEGA